MKNIKLIVEYDGTNYSGWQRQNNAMTIQQKIEEAIFKSTGESLDVIGCSRTDAGVHAKAFVLNFHTKSTIPSDKIKNVINLNLPEDIIILSSEEVEKEFHARYSCVAKTYSYTIFNRESVPALYRNYVYHVRKPLNVDIMIEASKYFLGKQDFSAFKNMGSSVKTSTRTIKDIEIYKENDYIKIYITADGFLYNMVKIIVGTLVQVGKGKMPPKQIRDIIESKDRSKAGKAVLSSGLCLEKVFY
ncbi:tRNA pseudouridine(38-40) synthase TruA [Clostridium algidicarnis]|uniref:tRNA pseudouridine(38-40) synthase TruA n=1 Tax=Clostridium algidicarnis TaxID=37659 RepID=UPI0004973FD1|nr:tRNA pseudouridine(38-40) synthase TruA [Clostridium algidicarnis]